jgi:5-methylthioadenosine/S-adenosylhomocysteine deaminase
MITVLDHALVLTVDPDRRILTDGAVAFDTEGTLVAVGPSDVVHAAIEGPTDVVDLTGRVIVPGYVDPHVHLGEQLARGLVPDDADPAEWLPDWLIPMYAALTPDDERLCADLAIAELLLTGTTTFCEAGTLIEWEPAADAVEAAGIRGQLGRWTWDLPPGPERMRRSSARHALDTAAELVDGVAGRGSDRLTSAVILLGLGTVSDALVRGAKELATDRGVPAAMMWASVAPQHGGGVQTAAQLAELGWLDEHTKLTHAVYVEDADVAQLIDAGVSIAHCPTAALRHVKGLPRYGKVPEMLAGGLNVGLGGDSANGSNHFDMHKLMFLAATLYKDHRMDPTMIPPETALEMATLHGAACLGLADRIGSLEAGKRADLVVYSTEHPEWRPMLHPVQNLVLNASDRSIESVWVDGRRLVDRGRLLSMDLPDVLERSDRAAAQLLDRIGLRAPWAWPAVPPRPEAPSNDGRMQA